MKKPGKTFMKKGIWVEFVQVRLLTRLVPSKASGDRSGAADAVIRRLFDVGAVVRVETRGAGNSILLESTNEKNFPITKVHAIPSPNTVFYHYPINEWKQSLPVEGWMLLLLMTAIAPRRRRIPSGAARERSSHVLDGTNLVSNRTCTN